MDLYTTLILLHIGGTILGVGGATFIEIHLKHFLKDGSMTPEERSVLAIDFFVTRVGMAIGFLTGLGFIWVYYSSNQMFRLESGVFWAKMAVFAIIIVNAYLLHKHKIGLYWGSALSFVSWWGAMILGVFLTNNVKILPTNNMLSFVTIMGVYAVIVIAGAKLLHILRERAKKTLPPSVVTP